MRTRTLAGALALAAGLSASAVQWAQGAEAGDAPAVSEWSVPGEGSCQPEHGLRGWPIGTDAPPFPFQPGDVFDLASAEKLRAFLPPALWQEREKFFFEGMRLEIGECFRDFSPPAFFVEATERFRGQGRLLENDGLEGYTAGLPFAPDDIAADDPQAGMRWAWNVANRYQAGGMFGRFRISDMVGRAGRAEPFEGEIFKAQLSHRADRADDDYEVPFARDRQWVAGGQFFVPFAAREHAWRQYRNLEHLSDPDRSDDLHAYLPEWRRVRRLSSANLEGLYMPSFSVGVVQPQVLGVSAAGGAAGAVGAAPPDSLATKRNGFEGLELRPLLHRFRVLGVHDVLAPINANGPTYPTAPDRDFGIWGLSFASDRWDLRRALVLEGTHKEARGGDHAARVITHVDLQTLQPLYYLSFDGQGERMDVGVYVGRWSEDRPDYLKWPDDPARPVRVIDSVGAAFANLSESGGWRRESWEIRSIPPPDKKLRRLISVTDLSKGR